MRIRAHMRPVTRPGVAPSTLVAAWTTAGDTPTFEVFLRLAQ